MALIKDIQHRADRINEVISSVDIKNRITDGFVRFLWDGVIVEFAPGEVKHVPRKMAEWWRDHTRYKFVEGDALEGTPSVSSYKLGIVGVDDTSDVTKAEVDKVKDLYDSINAPPKIDQETGKPFRTVYLNPASTGVMDTARQIEAREAKAVKQVSEAIVGTAATELADASAQASDEEVSTAWKTARPGVAADA